MIRIFTLAFLLFFNLASTAQLYNANTSIFPLSNAAALSEPLKVAIDKYGNTYMAGMFSSSIDADPGAGVFTLNSNFANNQDVYFIKLSPSGSLIWAKKVGGSGDEKVYDMVVDESGIYLAGSFTGTVDFNPGSGVANLTTGDGFFAKYDTSGAYVFAKHIKTGFFGTVDRIGVDSMKNVFIAVNVKAPSNNPITVDMDPHATNTLIFNVGMSYANLAFGKYDSLGNLIYARQIVGKLSTVRDFIVEKDGTMYITGQYANSGNDFDPTPSGTQILTTFNSTIFNGYFAKYTSSGNLIFIKTLKNNGSSGSYTSINKLKIGAQRNIYLAGNFNATVDFDPSTTIVNKASNGFYDSFVAAYDSIGNYKWVNTFGGAGNELLLSMDIDTSNKVYYTGYFSGTNVDFNPSTGTRLLSATVNVGFVGAMDSAGNFLFAEKISDSLSQGTGITIHNNYLYLIGNFSDSADFNFDGNQIITDGSTSNLNVFLTKQSFTPTGALPITLLNFMGENKANINILQWQFIQEYNLSGFEIEHSINGLNFTTIGNVPYQQNNNGVRNYTYLDNNLGAATNYYRLKIIDLNGTFIYSKTIRLMQNIRSKIAIFPNPVTSKLNVLTIAKNNGFKIINNLGETIIKGTLPQDNLIDVSQLLKGVYFLEMDKQMVQFLKY